MRRYDVRTYEITASAGQRLRSIAGGLVPVMIFQLVAGAGSYLGSKDSFERTFAVGGVTMITAFATVVVLVTRGRGPIALSVSEPGIHLAGVTVPWRLMRRVVVSGGTEVGIGLRPGAPLPDGSPGIVHDPRLPRAVHLRHEFPAGRIDPERLLAVVRAVAPPEVEVASRPAGEPQRPRPRTGHRRRDTWAVVTGVRLRSGRVRIYVRSRTSERVRVRPHPVVRFALPDGREVIAETGNKGRGEPGTWVKVSYDVDNPIDVRVDSRAPQSRWVRTW